MLKTAKFLWGCRPSDNKIVSNKTSDLGCNFTFTYSIYKKWQNKVQRFKIENFVHPSFIDASDILFIFKKLFTRKICFIFCGVLLCYFNKLYLLFIIIENKL